MTVALKPKRSEPKSGAEAQRANAAASHLLDERIRSLGGWRAHVQGQQLS